MPKVSKVLAVFNLAMPLKLVMLPLRHLSPIRWRYHFFQCLHDDLCVQPFLGNPLLQAPILVFARFQACYQGRNHVAVFGAPL